jgi:hypothetical protein
MGSMPVPGAALGVLLALSLSPVAAEAGEGCSTVVPIEVDELSHILVRFDVGGEEVQLFLDTGSVTAGIDIEPESLEGVRVSFTGETRKVRGWRGDVTAERSYTIPEVRLGDLVLKNVPGHEYLFSDTAEGAFSFAAFPDCNVLIDVPRKEFGLFPRGTPPAFLAEDGWRRFPMPPDHGAGAVLAARLVGADGEFVFGLDTGAIAIDDGGHHFNILRASSPFGRHVLGNGLLTPVDEAHAMGAFVTDRLLVDGRPLGPLAFMVVDFPVPEVDGFLGSAFFQDHSVYIDLARHELHVNRRRTRP